MNQGIGYQQMAKEPELQRKAMKGLTLVDGLVELGGDNELGERAEAGAAASRVGPTGEESEDIHRRAAAHERLHDVVRGNGVRRGEAGVNEDGVGEGARGLVLAGKVEDQVAGNGLRLAVAGDDEDRVGFQQRRIRERSDFKLPYRKINQI